MEGTWSLKAVSYSPRPLPALVVALALGRRLCPLRRRACRVSLDCNVRSLRSHPLTQYREVVLSSVDARHRLTPKQVVAGVALVDGKLMGRNSRPELGHLN